MKTHPTKEEDKVALRKRARDLSAKIGAGQVKQGRCYDMFHSVGDKKQLTAPTVHTEYWYDFWGWWLVSLVLFGTGTASVDGYGQKRRRVWRQARVFVVTLFVEARCFLSFGA